MRGAFTNSGKCDELQMAQFWNGMCKLYLLEEKAMRAQPVITQRELTWLWLSNQPGQSDHCCLIIAPLQTHFLLFHPTSILFLIKGIELPRQHKKYFVLLFVLHRFLSSHGRFWSLLRLTQIFWFNEKVNNYKKNSDYISQHLNGRPRECVCPSVRHTFLLECNISQPYSICTRFLCLQINAMWSFKKNCQAKQIL